MEFGLPITTSQPVSKPYTTINYQTTQEVQNVGLGNTLATTEVYPVTSYSKVSAPINTTVINYEVVRPTYIETSTPALTTQDYTATAYQTEVTNPAPSTSSYNTIPAVNYYQGVAPPVATSAQQKAVSLPQTVTTYKQVVTTRMEPRLVTKYTQVPVTKMISMEQAKLISLFAPQALMPIPTTPGQISQAPLVQLNPRHIIKTYPVYESDANRAVNPSILSPKPKNNNLNDFRSRTLLEPFVNPVLTQNGFVSGVNTGLPGLNTGLNVGLNTGLNTGLNAGLNTGLNTGLNQLGNNLTNTSNNLTTGITNPLNNVQNNLNNATNNLTSGVTNNVNNLNNAGTGALGNVRSGANEIANPSDNVKIAFENMKKQYKGEIKKLF